MLGDIRQAQKVYIVCGYTDMRKGLNSLVLFVQCKNRHPSPICTRFEHHFHALKPHLRHRRF